MASLQTATASAAVPWYRAFARTLLASLREHALLLAIVAVHLLVSAAMPVLLGRPLHFMVPLGPIVQRMWLIAFWCFLLAGVIGFAAAAIRKEQGTPLRSARVWLFGSYLRIDRIWGGIIVMAAFPVFAWSFGFLQALLPLLHPLDWDPTFAAWDAWLHFGRQPWEWLQPILGYPLVSSALSLVYALWFVALFGVNTWQAFSRRDPVVRMQYLISAVLIWAVIGNVGCTLLASGGPVYYGRLTGLPDPFAPLMQYLHAGSAVWHDFSVDIQETMWRYYLVNGQDGRINGAIAAMPSLHVATACSFYLVARASGRALGTAFLVFLLLMLVGSVHLGWHYAIDGYVGIAATVLLWHLCGWTLRRRALRRLLWGDAPAATS